jgi:transposase
MKEKRHTSVKRKFTRDFKLQLMHELKSGKDVGVMSREYNIHENQISKWRREYEKSPQEAFMPKKSKNKDDNNVAQLERMIGRLHMENDILKKALKSLEERLQSYRQTRGETQ